MLIHYRPQPAAGDVSVDLGCTYAGMAEHGLYATKVRPTFEQMRGKCMPQYVRAKMMEQAAGLAMGGQQFPEGLPGHFRPAAGYKQISARAALQYCRPASC